MRFLSRPDECDGPSRPLLSLVDIIFLLLVFFVMTAVFVAPETQLDTHLGASGAGGVPRPRDDVILELRWLPEGRVSARGVGLIADASGSRLFSAPMDPGARAVRAGWQTETWITDGRRRVPVTYRYSAPDMLSVESWLAAQRDFAASTGSSLPLSLVVDHDDHVPWEMVVRILDVGKRLGIRDVAVAMAARD